jgi:hypothetical protein
MSKWNMNNKNHQKIILEQWLFTEAGDALHRLGPVQIRGSDAAPMSTSRICQHKWQFHLQFSASGDKRIKF